MNQFDVIGTNSSICSFLYPKFWDLSSKYDVLIPNLIGPGPKKWNLSF